MSSQHKEILPHGTMIEDFRIESLIGCGAMASVYRAVQVNLDRTVALKVLPSEFAHDKDFVERFFNEARAAAALSHPNIVQAYDAGITDNNICYFAMEFVDGENLLDKIEREGPLPCAMALQILLEMARALDYGWQTQRLKHGDLKPANIMLNDKGDAKLADFGLAKIGDLEFDGEGIMLTPLYAAPELIMGKHNNNQCQADIYSFGATLYHLLTGAPPFPGDDPEEVMDQQVYAKLTPVAEKNPVISRKVSAVVDSLLAKAPEKRPQTWEEVIHKLKNLLKHNIRGLAVAVATPLDNKTKSTIRIKAKRLHTSTTSTRYTKNKKARHRWLLLAIIILIAANLIGVLLYWQFYGRQDNQLPESNNASGISAPSTEFSPTRPGKDAAEVSLPSPPPSPAAAPTTIPRRQNQYEPQDHHDHHADSQAAPAPQPWPAPEPTPEPAPEPMPEPEMPEPTPETASSSQTATNKEPDSWPEDFEIISPD